MDLIVDPVLVCSVNQISTLEWESRSMSQQDAPEGAQARRYRKLKLSGFEQAIIGAMLLVLTIAALDAFEGNYVGQNNSVETAKLQGQQEFMATTLK